MFVGIVGAFDDSSRRLCASLVDAKVFVEFGEGSRQVKTYSLVPRSCPKSVWVCYGLSISIRVCTGFGHSSDT